MTHTKRSITSYIPNTVTCLNLLSGCVAVYMAFNIDRQIGCATGAAWAMTAIAAAAVSDFLDGASARLLHAYSPLGKDLDSLSDMVSFGVAPAMLILNVMLGYSSTPWLCFAAFLLPVCGALRLAIFNNDTEQTSSFRGLPIPANAIFWIGMYGWISRYGYPGTAIMVILIVLLSLAMVGRFKMFSLKFKNFDFSENFCRYVIIVAAVVFVIIYGLAGLSWTILLYFLLSLLRRDRI